MSATVAPPAFPPTWHLLPLAPARKEPAKSLVPHGSDQATTDPATIAGWLRAFPEIGWGVALAPAGLLVIGPDNAARLAEFERRGLPPTAMAESRPGHRHYYYRRPDGCPVHRICRSGEFDILSNGYAVLPPSVHPDTDRPYRWLVTPEEVGELPEAPAWAMAMLTEAATRRRADLNGKAPAPTAAAGDEPPIRLDAAGAALWSGETVITRSDGAAVDRSATLWHIGLALARAGLSARWIAAAVQDRDAALGFRKYTGRSDAATRYATIGQRTAEPRRSFQAGGPAADTEAADVAALRADLAAVTAERDGLRRELDQAREAATAWHAERISYMRAVDQSTGVTAALARLESTSYKAEKPTVLALARAYGAAPPDRHRGDGWIALAKRSLAADLHLDASTIGRHLTRIAGVEVDKIPIITPDPDGGAPDFQWETRIKIGGVPADALGTPEGIIAAADRLAWTAPVTPPTGPTGATHGGTRTRRFCTHCRHEVDVTVRRRLVTTEHCGTCGSQLGQPVSVPYIAGQHYGKPQSMAIGNVGDESPRAPQADGQKMALELGDCIMQSPPPPTECVSCGGPVTDLDGLCDSCWLNRHPLPALDSGSAVAAGAVQGVDHDRDHHSQGGTHARVA